MAATDLQTFYVASPTADLIFHAESASEVWFPTPSVFYADDGTIVSPIGTGSRRHLHRPVGGHNRHARTSCDRPQRPGTVTGDCARATPSCRTPTRRFRPWPKSVTAGATTTYDRVQDLISWIGAHTHYSTDIPALPPGADTVDEFLFGNRIGYCEQISTALAVMLRTLDIPVREVVGYVPGPYNPVTDLYTIEADDAHAWVQVWIPGYGWQSFDPTASVPLANPRSGRHRPPRRGRRYGGHLPVGAGIRCSSWWPGWAWPWFAGAGPRPATWAEQRGPSTSNEPAAGPGGRAAPPRRSSSTPPPSTILLAEGSVACRRLAATWRPASTAGVNLPPEVQRVMPDRSPSGFAAGERRLDRAAGCDRDRAVRSGVHFGSRS